MKYDDYVVVVPLVLNVVIVQKQYKPGAEKVCFGFPAGFIKKNENPLVAARRELFEETGVKAKRWIKLGCFYDNVSVTSAKFTIYLATELYKSAYKGNPDLSESKIENMRVGVEKLESIKMEGACMALAKELFRKHLVT